jgi:hypothetical protein
MAGTRIDVWAHRSRRTFFASVSLGLALLSCPDGSATASDSIRASTSESTGSPGAGDSVLVGIVAGLSRDTPLRMKVRTDGIIEGILVNAHSESLVVSPELWEERSIAFDEIETLWIHGGNKQKSGTKWGALLGGVAGPILMTALILQSPVEGDLGPAVLAGIPLGIAGGVLIGSGIGALVGRLTPAWAQQYPESDRGEPE